MSTARVLRSCVPLQDHKGVLASPHTHGRHTNQFIVEKVIGRQKSSDYGSDESFFVADFGNVRRQLARWWKCLPSVQPYYAVKCNNDPNLLKLLAESGVNFDCASRNEIEAILGMEVSPERIVYANTVKNPGYLRYSVEKDVRLMTFDNSSELEKIAICAPKSRLLLRIATDDSGASCQLSLKFGAAMDSALSLLEKAREHHLDVVGVAFHIGSGGGAAIDAFRRALVDTRRIFQLGASLGYDMQIVDIGGGFESATFEDAASQINQTFSDLCFPQSTRLIAEPGRFFAADAYTLVASVIGQRRADDGTQMVYLTDGVYGNLNCIIFDHQSPAVHPLYANGDPRSRPPTEISLWGPTCDGIDIVHNGIHVPHALEIGDWVYFPAVGAYTLSASSAFNGFCMDTQIYYADS